MSSRSQKPDETPPPVRELQGAESAYGARIDALFREAIRDLDRLRQTHPAETAKP